MKSMLIVGLLQFNSGKTTISKEIAEFFANKNIDIGYVKPISAFNAWYNYDVLERSIEAKKLLSGDVLKMERYVDDPELANPICMMLSPIDPKKIEWSWINYESYYNQLAMLRIKADHYTIESDRERFPDFVEEKMSEFLSNVRSTDICLEEFERIVDNARKLSDEILRDVRRKKEITIIESTSNLSAPSKDALSSDSVILVCPGRVAIIDSDRYRNAIDILGKLKDPWNLTTESLVELIKPEISFNVTPRGVDKKFFEEISDIIG